MLPDRGKEYASLDVSSNKAEPAISTTLPAITIGTSQDYLDKAVGVASHAVLPSIPWRNIFGGGVEMSDEQRLQSYESIIKEFLTAGVASGAFVAEAGNFSACALWHPPGSHQAPKEYQESVPRESQVGSLRERFDQEVQKVMIERVWSKYQQNYWYLGLLARDPRKVAVPGAVRAVLQPFMERAAREKSPIWLVTTNEDAKDMYLHFGWELASVITIEEHRQWCMILLPPDHE